MSTIHFQETVGKGRLKSAFDTAVKAIEARGNGRAAQ
jgi:hypothetical protein